MKFIIPQSMRALDALKQLFPESSRRTLQHWLQGGRFTVDGERLTRDSEMLEQGQELQCQESFNPKQAEQLNILFEDRYCLAIEKPVGLLSVPLDTSAYTRNALGILRTSYRTDQIFAVHRIDRETSGVLLFARGTLSQDKFKDLFEKHDLEREYFAIVEGRIPQDRGTWECTLKELPNYDVDLSSDPEDGKRAITHFEVLRRSPKYSYLRLLLETGRKHQIRVHCKQAGFPVLGDKRYGSTENPLRRMALHAKRLAFVHPFTKRKIDLTSPLPFLFKKLGADIETPQKDGFS